MRHALRLGVVLLLFAAREGLATGNQPPPCRTGPWVATGSMTTPRTEHAATLLPSGKVLVSGGADPAASESVVFATAELYDPAVGTWSPTGSMTIQRHFHTMTLLPTGKVLVTGGLSGGPDTRPAELYDPDTGQWTATGAMLNKRAYHTATLLPTGKVLVVGGIGEDGFVASAELYDLPTGQWHATGALSEPRRLHTATLLASGKVLVVGGLSSSGPTSSAELYDPSVGTWTTVAPMLTARYAHTATLLLTGAVLVAGGLFETVSIEAELYDPAVGNWRRTGSPIAGHAELPTATRLPSGRVLVVGGGNTALFDPGSDNWSDAGCPVRGRTRHTATLLRSGLVLVAGGSRDSSAELYGIFVSPGQVSLAPGASQTFTASGGSLVGYVWSFAHNESGGTLTPSGTYQAGPAGGVTDVLQVVDSYGNSATATVNVLRQATAVSSRGSAPESRGCTAAEGAALPSLAGAVLVLLGWRPLRVRRPGCIRGSAG